MAMRSCSTAFLPLGPYILWVSRERSICEGGVIWQKREFSPRWWVVIQVKGEAFRPLLFFVRRARGGCLFCWKKVYPVRLLWKNRASAGPQRRGGWSRVLDSYVLPTKNILLLAWCTRIHKGMRRKDGCFKRENSLFGVRSENNSSRIIKMSCWVIGHAWPSFGAQNETGIFALRMTDADTEEKERLCKKRRMHSTCFLSFYTKNRLKAHMTFPVFV